MSALCVAVAEALVHLAKHELPVLNGAKNLDIPHRVAFQERSEELNEPFLSVPDTGGMLRLAVARILIERFDHVAVSDTFEVKAFGICDTDTICHHISP